MYLLNGASAFVHGLHRKEPNALKNIRLSFFTKENFSVISDFFRVSVYVFTDLSCCQLIFIDIFCVLSRFFTDFGYCTKTLELREKICRII